MAYKTIKDFFIDFKFFNTVFFNDILQLCKFKFYL